jgi:hypothetical protein
MVRMYDGVVLIEACNKKEKEVLAELIFSGFFNGIDFALIESHFMLKPNVDVEVIEKWLVEQLGYEVEPLFEF